jgi:hypothetical protein
MTQKQQIKTALERGETLTLLDALHRFGCFRLSARILELRRGGMPIETVRHKDGYAMYRRGKAREPSERMDVPIEW